MKIAGLVGVKVGTVRSIINHYKHKKLYFTQNHKKEEPWNKIIEKMIEIVLNAVV